MQFVISTSTPFPASHQRLHGRRGKLGPARVYVPPNFDPARALPGMWSTDVTQARKFSSLAEARAFLRDFGMPERYAIERTD